jgi:DNA-binding NarL/FixJ family response regulator
LLRLLEPKVTVVGGVTDGRALVQAALALRPDVVVTDVSMPELSGLEAARKIRQMLPATRVIVLTVYEDPALAAAAFRAGASGFVVKSSAASELFEAIRTALANRCFLTRRVADGDLDALPSPGLPLERLSPREREVLELLAEGRSMKQVGARLGITPRTVAFHKYRLMAKLAIRSTAGLVRFAARRCLAHDGGEGPDDPVRALAPLPDRPCQF